MARTREPVSARELELVRTAYEMWNRGDTAGLAAICFADDIEWQNSPEFPGQRTYRGSHRVAHFLKEEVADIVELGEIEIDRMEVLGDEVLTALRARTRGAESDLDIGKIRLFHVLRLQRGRIARVRVYLTEGEAVEAIDQGL